MRIIRHENKASEENIENIKICGVFFKFLVAMCGCRVIRPS